MFVWTTLRALSTMRPVMNVVTTKDERAVAQDKVLSASAGVPKPATMATRSARKPRCEDCFFHQNMLCALEDKKPCPTFRPAHPDGLRPPRQLSFVFRQGRRPDPFAFEAPVAQT
jgi:hypothetical protein